MQHGMFTRTIVAALDPWRFEDSYTEIMMRVWFEEFDGWLPFVASPLDCERHGKELWIRAMAGEYGPIEVRQRDHTAPRAMVVNHPPLLLSPPQ